MDPGAELNLIKKKLITHADGSERKIKIHARERTNVTLCNNGVEIGTVKEAIFITFSLDGVDGNQQTYHDWFYVWEGMNEEMILGATFCREHTFTNFHIRLMPWEGELLGSSRASTKASIQKRKRDLENIDVIPSDATTAYERHVEPLLPDPRTISEQHTRDRVITNCEKNSSFAKEACYAEQGRDPDYRRQARASSTYLHAAIAAQRSQEPRACGIQPTGVQTSCQHPNAEGSG
jgi:hypothetical protein